MISLCPSNFSLLDFTLRTIPEMNCLHEPLNTHSYLLNFYSFLNEKNPYYYDQMNWMMKELTQAEQAGEKVMFFLHVNMLITRTLHQNIGCMRC